MKKKILFIIPSLALGGAEKSLVNLLNIIDLNQYEIEVSVFKKGGIFEELIPADIAVNLIPTSGFHLPLVLSVFYLFKKGNAAGLIRRIRFALNIKFNNSAVAEQKNWHFQKDFYPSAEKKYDVAIAFLEKTSIYYLIDKINAEKKIGWIHTDYNQSGLKAAIDSPYFSGLNFLVTISETCKKSLVQNFPAIKEKIVVIPNLSSATMIREMSEIAVEVIKRKYNFVTVARLSPEKGIDLAIETAAILKKNKLDFYWNILGDGPEKESLQNLITEKKLEDCIILSGSKINPYPYIKLADFYIQPSRYEGKSIAIDESLILGIPVIANNYSSVADQIHDGLNGFVAGTTPEELSAKIFDLLQNQEDVEIVKDNLREKENSNEREIIKLYELID